ncbi:hypothetical protein ACCUM_1887 [Candidatus Accumulibacter phosphatis]|uniref:Uncharacterized protein n=1 Tax=Candidatus Accumulibacter phosphatis TaxID=327160 RepID=A0A5S4EIL2_9PROT|nr:hypothetical protein ACCUM_1887 [Candidatus Accumulibacter phosphatis]
MVPVGNRPGNDLHAIVSTVGFSATAAVEPALDVGLQWFGYLPLTRD